MTTAAGQFKFSQSDLKWVPHESIACDWHISESTIAEILSQISYRVAFLFANSNAQISWTIYCLDSYIHLILKIFKVIWLFLGDFFVISSKIYFKTFFPSAILMLLACHKKSYLVCDEITNFWIFMQPVPNFSKYKTETAKTGQRQLLENK